MNQWDCTVNIPFRKNGSRRFLPDAVFDFDEKYIDLYAAAVTREVIAASEGLEDIHIARVEITGCAALIRGSMLGRIAASIRRYLPVDESTIWIVHGEAGSLTEDFVRFCVELPVSELRLDYRTASAKESLEMGYQPTTGEYPQDLRLLKQAGFERYSIVISDNGCNKTDAIFEDTVRNFSTLGAAWLRLPLCLTGSRAEKAAGILIAQGYQAFAEAPACYVREGFAPVRETVPDGILGIGMNAVTCLPEGKCKNTNDLFLYLSHSDDVSMISKIVR